MKGKRELEIELGCLSSAEQPYACQCWLTYPLQTALETHPLMMSHPRLSLVGRMSSVQPAGWSRIASSIQKSFWLCPMGCGSNEATNFSALSLVEKMAAIEAPGPPSSDSCTTKSLIGSTKVLMLQDSISELWRNEKVAA